MFIYKYNTIVRCQDGWHKLVYHQKHRRFHSDAYPDYRLGNPSNVSLLDQGVVVHVHIDAYF